MAMHFYFCVLSAIHSYEAGPALFTYDEPEDIAELAQELAKEIAPKLEPELSFEMIQTILQDALQLFSNEHNDWLLQYTGRKTYYVKEDNFYRTGVVIGPRGSSPKIDVRRVEGYSRDCREWDTLLIEGENKEVVRISEVTQCGGLKGSPIFCWEGPYTYFKHWLRSSSVSISHLDDAAFADFFFRLVDSDHDGCLHRRRVSGLLPCIPYGAIQNTQDGEEELLRAARTDSKSIASAIAAGARGKDLWPALAADFGAWMVTRPDIWPSPPAQPHLIPIPISSGSETIFHTLPPEIVLQIIPLLDLHDLISVQLVSHSVRAIISPLLDTTLWHHVHFGSLRWILPIHEVEGEVERANLAATKWSSSTLPSSFENHALEPVFNSKGFPFLSFIRECLQNSDSMRNRQRLWRISQQFRLLWESRFP
ncbi:F-box domain-containing protein [Favolaschia claudopus]|uniref:F-box domain-containing protein n=1 Tax=Favolaschia claudopus TaxID=2862362 RepID=A0AAV9ZDH8_9AGAR